MVIGYRGCLRHAPTKGEEAYIFHKAVTNRLFLYDARILSYYARTILSKVSDIAALIVILGVTVIAVRHGLANLEPAQRSWAVSITAMVLATYLYAMLHRRLSFFQAESILAADAQTPVIRFLYIISHALWLSLLITLAFIAPHGGLLSAYLLSFFAGLGVAAALFGLAHVLFGLDAQWRPSWLSPILASRYSGGAIALITAVGAAIILLASIILNSDSAAIISALLTIGIGLWYSPVSADTVEYEGVVGLSPLYSVGSRMVRLIAIGFVLSGAAALMQQWEAALAGALLTLFGASFKSLEILAIRAVGIKMAQLCMSVSIAVMLGASTLMPLSAAVVIPACLWWLLSRGTERTWRIV